MSLLGSLTGFARKLSPTGRKSTPSESSRELPTTPPTMERVMTMASALPRSFPPDRRSGCEKNRHAPRRAMSGQCTEVAHRQLLDQRGAKLACLALFTPLGAPDETKFSASHAVRFEGSAQRRSIGSSSINRMRSVLASLISPRSARRLRQNSARPTRSYFRAARRGGPSAALRSTRCEACLPPSLFPARCAG